MEFLQGLHKTTGCLMKLIPSNINGPEIKVTIVSWEMRTRSEVFWWSLSARQATPGLSKLVPEVRVEDWWTRDVASDSVMSFFLFLQALRGSLAEAANLTIWIGSGTPVPQKVFITKNTNFSLRRIFIICLKQIINNLYLSSFELFSTSIWGLHFSSAIQVS